MLSCVSVLPNFTNILQVYWTGPVFCLLIGVSSDYAQPITGQVTEVTCPVIGQAQPELTPSSETENGPWSWGSYILSQCQWSSCQEYTKSRLCNHSYQNTTDGVHIFILHITYTEMILIGDYSIGMNSVTTSH